MTKPSLFSRMTKVMAALQTAITEGRAIHRELERAQNLANLVAGLKAKQRPRKRRAKK